MCISVFIVDDQHRHSHIDALLYSCDFTKRDDKGYLRGLI